MALTRQFRNHEDNDFRLISLSLPFPSLLNGDHNCQVVVHACPGALWWVGHERRQPAVPRSYCWVDVEHVGHPVRPVPELATTVPPVGGFRPVHLDERDPFVSELLVRMFRHLTEMGVPDPNAALLRLVPVALRTRPEHAVHQRRRFYVRTTAEPLALEVCVLEQPAPVCQPLGRVRTPVSVVTGPRLPCGPLPCPPPRPVEDPPLRP